MSWSWGLVKPFPVLSWKRLLVCCVLLYISCLCLFPTCFLCVFIHLSKSMFFFHSSFHSSVHLFHSSRLFFVSCTLRWLMGVLCVPAFIPCGFCFYFAFMYFPFFNVFFCWILFSLVSFPGLLLSDFLLPAFFSNFWMLALLIKLTWPCIRVVFCKYMAHWTDAEEYRLCNVFAFVNPFLPYILEHLKHEIIVFPFTTELNEGWMLCKERRNRPILSAQIIRNTATENSVFICIDSN